MSKRQSAVVPAVVKVLLAAVVLLGQGCAGSSSPSLSDPSDESPVLRTVKELVFQDLAIYEAVVVNYYNYNMWRYNVRARDRVKDGTAFLCLSITFFDPPDECLERLNSRGVLVRRGSEFREDVDEGLFVGTFSILSEQDDKQTTVVVGSSYQEYKQERIYHLVEAEDGWNVSFSHELGEMLCDRCNPGIEQIFQDDRVKHLFDSGGR